MKIDGEERGELEEGRTGEGMQRREEGERERVEGRLGEERESGGSELRGENAKGWKGKKKESRKTEK